ncbi:MULTISPECIES: hypothetical protein [unclassified Streptomyces]|uniref:hypothetical protein n=1 Tax=unclassified Streptomyces TaxID=2593676 RepID=UPI003683FF9E
MTWLDDTEVITLFATRLAHADESALLDRLFTTMAEEGRPSLLRLGASARLRRAVTDWRRSRSQ